MISIISISWQEILTHIIHWESKYLNFQLKKSSKILSNLNIFYAKNILFNSNILHRFVISKLVSPAKRYSKNLLLTQSFIPSRNRMYCTRTCRMAYNVRHYMCVTPRPYSMRWVFIGQLSQPGEWRGTHTTPCKPY